MADQQNPVTPPDEATTRAALPEEVAADDGFDSEQATRAILEESEERVNDPDAGISEGGDDLEHRRSEDTV